MQTNDCGQLWRIANYTTPIIYKKGYYIREYDITKANISVLRAYGLISQDKFNQMAMMNKLDREMQIGKQIAQEKLIDDEGQSKTQKTIQNGIENAKHILFKENHIIDDEVLRIANDSVLVCRHQPLENQVIKLCDSDLSQIFFDMKGLYTTFIRLAKVVLLFNSQTNNVDVKGINDSKLPLHEHFLFEICDILRYKEIGDSKVALMKYHEFYDDYVKLKLLPEFYREFNSESAYRIKTKENSLSEIGKRIGMIYIPDDFDLEKLDISYNIFVLRNLYKVLIS